MVFAINGLTEVTMDQLMEYNIDIDPTYRKGLSAREEFQVNEAVKQLNKLKESYVSYLLLTYNFDGDSVLSIQTLSSSFKIFLYCSYGECLVTYKQLNRLINIYVSKLDSDEIKPLIDFYTFVHSCM